MCFRQHVVANLHNNYNVAASACICRQFSLPPPPPLPTPTRCVRSVVDPLRRLAFDPLAASKRKHADRVLLSRREART